MDYFKIPKYTPGRLHGYASRYNWDDGYFILERMIEGDNCALGTALILYWLGKPHYFRQYKKAAEAESWERDNYRFLRKIEQGVRSGRFAVHGIAFDPRKDDCCFEVTYPEIPKAVDLPSYMMIYTTKTGVFDFDDNPAEMTRKVAKKKTAKKKTAKKKTAKKKTAKKKTAKKKTAKKKTASGST